MGTNTNYHSHEVVQVADSLETLELILEDAKSATGVFDAATTSRWLGYSEEFLGLLRDVGLKDFRRSRQFLNRFGATDRNPDFSRRSPEEMLHSARSLFLADGAV